MSRIFGIFCALCLALVVAGWSCTGDSSGAKDRSKSENGSGAEKATASAEAYAALKREVGALQQSATTQQKMLDALEQTVSKLERFIASYPGSEEAKDAKLQLGMVHSAMGQYEKAAASLEGYVEGADEADERTGYAHFYLAEAYKNLDRYDDAQKHFELFVAQYPHVNPAFIAQAKASLDDLPALRRLAVGMEPIPFSVKDTQGNPLSLAKYRGKVVLLDFWASWCAPCKIEMPSVVKLHKKYRNRGFEIIGISLDNDRKAFESYIKAAGMEWPQYFDGKGWQNEVAQMYKVRAIPATFLLDKKGKIRYRSLRGPDLEKAIQKLLEEA